MMLLALLVASAQNTETQISITEPYLQYNSCLLENPSFKDSWKNSRPVAERPKLANQIIADCSAVRRRVRPIMEARLKAAAPDSDAPGQVKMLLDAANDHIRVFLDERETLMKVKKAYYECLEKKGPDQC